VAKRSTRLARLTTEQFLARLDVAIERQRAALDELIALRRAIAGDPAGLTDAEERELAELVAHRAARLRKSGGGR
jgi:hypothetical protein